MRSIEPTVCGSTPAFARCFIPLKLAPVKAYIAPFMAPATFNCTAGAVRAIFEDPYKVSAKTAGLVTGWT